MIRLKPEYGGEPEGPEETESWTVHEQNLWGEKTCRILESFLPGNIYSADFYNEEEHLYTVTKISPDAYTIKNIKANTSYSVTHLGDVTHPLAKDPGQDKDEIRYLIDQIRNTIPFLEKRNIIKH